MRGLSGSTYKVLKAPWRYAVQTDATVLRRWQSGQMRTPGKAFSFKKKNPGERNFFRLNSLFGRELPWERNFTASVFLKGSASSNLVLRVASYGWLLRNCTLVEGAAAMRDFARFRQPFSKRLFKLRPPRSRKPAAQNFGIRNIVT